MIDIRDHMFRITTTHIIYRVFHVIGPSYNSKAVDSVSQNQNGVAVSRDTAETYQMPVVAFFLLTNSTSGMEFV